MNKKQYLKWAMEVSQEQWEGKFPTEVKGGY